MGGLCLNIPPALSVLAMSSANSLRRVGINCSLHYADEDMETQVGSLASILQLGPGGAEPAEHLPGENRCCFCSLAGAAALAGGVRAALVYRRIL